MSVASDGGEIVGFGESIGGVGMGKGENAESEENENEEAAGEEQRERERPRGPGRFPNPIISGFDHLKDRE